MSHEEKILNDVSETEDTGHIEAFVRFNNDLEKDYGFQFKTSDTFGNLYTIFRTLPIALRPNLFYSSVPVGFRVSTAPGYLTEDGALLFSYEADHKKYTRNVANSDRIAENIWPGQLILPVWEFNTFGFYAFLSFLVTWLYTDLPDFISPTPGICLTTQATKLAHYLITLAGFPDLANTILDDILEPVGTVAQCLFFVFHLIKVGVLFLFVHTGAFNPIKLLRFSSNKVPTDVTKEQLIAIGWTGSRRANPDDYKEFYRDYKIKEHGGMIPAHQAGVFEKLRNLGTFLGEGEGFNTPLDTKATVKDLLDEDNEKLLLSYEYFAKLGEFFQNYIEENESNVTEAIKQYRRYGILHSSDQIKEIVEKRKKFGDSRLAK